MLRMKDDYNDQDDENYFDDQDDEDGDEEAYENVDYDEDEDDDDEDDEDDAPPTLSGGRPPTSHLHCWPTRTAKLSLNYLRLSWIILDYLGLS